MCVYIYIYVKYIYIGYMYMHHYISHEIWANEYLLVGRWDFGSSPKGDVELSMVTLALFCWNKGKRLKK